MIGERLVADQLVALRKRDPRWGFLHSIPVGKNGSDIDHLLIGPGGIFSLNAKHHAGARIWVGGNTVLVNGVKQPYVRNSRHEAARVSRLMSAAVGVALTAVGVVVPVAAGSFVVKQQPEDVRVINRFGLVKFFRRLPESYPRELVEALFEAARDPATWGTR